MGIISTSSEYKTPATLEAFGGLSQHIGGVPTMPDSTSEFSPTKKCTRCGAEYPRTSQHFYRKSSRRDGLTSHCKACVNQANSQWCTSNPDKRRAAERRRYAKNPKHYCDANRHKRERNPERYHESVRRWAASHPDKLREKDRRRRARMMGASGTHTVQDMRRQYDAQKGKCWWCGKPVEWEKRHDDHLIPLSKGGTNWPNNMVVSCAFCNQSKHDKLPHEFSGRLF